MLHFSNTFPVSLNSPSSFPFWMKCSSWQGLVSWEHLDGARRCLIDPSFFPQTCSFRGTHLLDWYFIWTGGVKQEEGVKVISAGAFFYLLSFSVNSKPMNVLFCMSELYLHTLSARRALPKIKMCIFFWLVVLAIYLVSRGVSFLVFEIICFLSCIRE